MLKEEGRFVEQVSDVSLFTDLPDHEQVRFRVTSCVQHSLCVSSSVSNTLHVENDLV